MLALARALVTNPKLLLLDEPMEGLAPIVVQELAAVLRELAGAGSMAIVLVEQHAELALSLAPRGVVMERGRVVHDGDAAGLLSDRVRLDRWLGAAAAAAESYAPRAPRVTSLPEATSESTGTARAGRCR
jgi:branched-chain amino acid transport system ATP-binding protein